MVLVVQIGGKYNLESFLSNYLSFTFYFDVYLFIFILRLPLTEAMSLGLPVSDLLLADLTSRGFLLISLVISIYLANIYAF